MCSENQYPLTIMVSLHQELEIMQLFYTKGWEYTKYEIEHDDLKEAVRKKLFAFPEEHQITPKPSSKLHKPTDLEKALASYPIRKPPFNYTEDEAAKCVVETPMIPNSSTWSNRNSPPKPVEKNSEPLLASSACETNQQRKKDDPPLVDSVDQDQVRKELDPKSGKLIEQYDNIEEDDNEMVGKEFGVLEKECGVPEKECDVPDNLDSTECYLNYPELHMTVEEDHGTSHEQNSEQIGCGMVKVEVQSDSDDVNLSGENSIVTQVMDNSTDVDMGKCDTTGTLDDSNVNSIWIGNELMNINTYLKTLSQRQVTTKRKRAQNAKIKTTKEEKGSACIKNQFLSLEDQKLNEMSLLMANQCDNAFICCICNLVFSTLDDFKLHTKNVCLADLQNSKNKFKCQECKTYFKAAYTLVRHRLSGICEPRTATKSTSILKCQFCGKTYPPRQKSEFSIHVMTHTNLKPHVCDVCDKTFTRWQSLRDHKRIHSGDKPYKCSYCPKVFPTGTHLRNHITVNHMDVPKSFVCEKCGASFKFKSRLTEHLKTVHTDVRNFECDECGKKYKKNIMLVEHKKTHRNVYDKVCDICGKAFIKQSGLSSHRKLHTQKLNMFCEYCGKGFFRKANLILHTRTHTGEKPFACSFCTYKCTTNGNLQKHIRAVHQKSMEN